MTHEDHCLWCMTSRQGEASCPRCGRRKGDDVEPHPMYLAAGTVLDGKYLLGRVLGHGSFGITYLGLDVHLDFRVAIKEYLPRDLATRAPDGSSVSAYRGEAGDDFRFGLTRFLEEGRSLARFREHPRVVGVLGFFEANGTGYLVMSYLEGKSLEEHRAAQQGGRLPEAEALGIMVAVLDGLEAVHGEGMLHRDVKPANIYLTRYSGVKLLDFGAARYATGQRSRSLTQIWTPGYAPFEQCHGGGEQGPWSDVYAAGATLYHLLTGEVPIESNVRAVKDVQPSPREVAGAAVDERVSAAVMQAMAVDPQERFQSVGAFRTALMEAKKVTDIGPSLDAEDPAEERDKADSDPSPDPASKAGVAVDEGIEVGDDEAERRARRRALIDVASLHVMEGRLTEAKNAYEIVLALYPGDTNAAAGLEKVKKMSRERREERPTKGLIEMVRIPAGTFEMGSTEDEEGRSLDETRHRVKISRDFLMGVTPVTQGQWEEVMKNDPSHFQSGGGDHPVESICWYDALRLCNRLSEMEGLAPAYSFKKGIIKRKVAAWNRSADGYRLPTEEEWEYACRARTTTRFNMGNAGTNLDRAGWYDANSCGKTNPVGRKASNAFGLYDMHGNVWEWCWDRYKESYLKGAVAEPTGLDWGLKRVISGGGWGSFDHNCRSANRSSDTPGHRYYDLGFRLARSVGDKQDRL